MLFPDHPILRKELLTRLRSGRTFVALGLWIVMSCAAMGFGWTRGSTATWPRARIKVMTQVRWASQPARWQQSSVRTPKLVQAAFYFTVFGQLLLAAAVAPAFAVGAFTVERKAGTHDLLLTTPISPLSMAVAKLLSCTCVMVLLVVSSLPALSMVLLFGGVDGTELLLSAGVVVVAVILFSAIGLFWSAWRRTTVQAALASYLVIGFIAGLTFAPDTILRRPSKVFRRPTTILRVFRKRECVEDTVWVSPFSVALLVADARGQTRIVAPAVSALLAQTLAAIVLTALSSFGVRRTREPTRPRGEGLIADGEKLRERRTQFPYYLIDPLRRRSQIADGANPVFVRELRATLFRSGATWVRIFYASIIVHLTLVPCLLVYADLESRRYLGNIAIVQCLILACLAPVATAGALAREREGGTLDMLRTTLLSGTRLIWGKVLASLACGALILAGALLSWMATACARFIAWQAFLIIAVNIVGSYVLAVGLCILVSTLIPRTAVAYPVSYGLAILTTGLGAGAAIVFCLAPHHRALETGTAVTAAVVLTLGYALATVLVCQAAVLVYRLRTRN